MRDSNSAVWLVGFLWQLQSSISPPLSRQSAFVSPLFTLLLSLWSWQRKTLREGIKLHQGFNTTHSCMNRNTHTHTHILTGNEKNTECTHTEWNAFQKSLMHSLDRKKRKKEGNQTDVDIKVLQRKRGIMLLLSPAWRRSNYPAALNWFIHQLLLFATFAHTSLHT